VTLDDDSSPFKVAIGPDTIPLLPTNAHIKKAIDLEGTHKIGPNPRLKQLNPEEG
jgi:hypothetical protein